MKNEKEYIKTGFNNLDEALGGGLKKGELTLLAARPGFGKTSFATNILINSTLNNGIKSIFFSIEMPKEQLESRILSLLSNIDLKRVNDNELSDNDLNAIAHAKDVLVQKNIIIDDSLTVNDEDVLIRCEKIK